AGAAVGSLWLRRLAGRAAGRAGAGAAGRAVAATVLLALLVAALAPVGPASGRLGLIPAATHVEELAAEHDLRPVDLQVLVVLLAERRFHRLRAFTVVLALRLAGRLAALCLLSLVPAGGLSLALTLALLETLPVRR